MSVRPRRNPCCVPFRSLCLLVALALCTMAAQEKHVREPAVAGTFYPSSRAALERDVKEFLAKARPQVPEALKDKRPLALVVPHASYNYSGRTAAYAYKLLEGRRRPSRVILLGPSHRVYLHDSLSVAPYTHYATPLGEMVADAAARDGLLKLDLCLSRESADRREHNIEVQLPFLQTVWKEPPPVLPVLVGDLRGENLRLAARAIGKLVDEDTLLIASTDFTHYGRNYGYAPFKETGDALAARIKELDMGAVKKMDALDAEGFLKYCEETGATICGRGAVALLLQTLSGIEGVRGVSLHYATSADVTGDVGNSVSYCAHAFYRPDDAK